MEKNDVNLRKLQKYSYINNRSHYTPNCTRKEAGCIQNAIITNADCRLRSVHRACICLQREIRKNTKIRDW